MRNAPPRGTGATRTTESDPGIAKLFIHAEGIRRRYEREFHAAAGVFEAGGIDGIAGIGGDDGGTAGERNGVRRRGGAHCGRGGSARADRGSAQISHQVCRVRHEPRPHLRHDWRRAARRRRVGGRVGRRRRQAGRVPQALSRCEDREDAGRGSRRSRGATGADLADCQRARRDCRARHEARQGFSL